MDLDFFVNKLINDLSTEVVKKTPQQFDGVDLNDFKSATFNDKKGIVTVVLKDGRVGIAKCGSNDTYDKFVGFSLALLYAHLNVSKGSYQSFVNEVIKQSEK